MPLTTFLDGRSRSRLTGLQFLALSDTGYILSRTVVSDAGGGGSVTYGTAGTVACRIDPISAREDTVGGRISDRSTHLITIPAGTAVDVEQRFVISGRGTFEVLGVRKATREWVRSLEALEI